MIVMIIKIKKQYESQYNQPNSTQIQPKTKQIKVNQSLLTLMRESGLNQAELGHRVLKDRAYINRILRGTQEAPTMLKIKIAKVFGVDSRTIWPDYYIDQENNKSTIATTTTK